MNKIITLSFLFASIVLGQQLSLNFSTYTSGSTLENQDGWTTNVPSAAQALIRSAIPLTYSGFGSGGNYISVSTISSVLYFTKPFTSSVSISPTGTIYYAMLVNIQSADALGANCFFLDGSALFGRIWIKDNGTGKWQVGISKNNLSLVWGTNSFNYDQTYLLMVRYTFNSGSDDDEAYVWVNPPLTGEPSTVSAEAVSGNGQAEYTSIAQCNGVMLYLKLGTPAWRIDDIRVGYGLTHSSAFAELNYDGALPVELTKWSAAPIAAGVQLNWTTVGEVNNHGFEIERKMIETGRSVNDNWYTITSVGGSGNSNTRTEYSYLDRNIPAGRYAYRLKQIDRNGASVYSNALTVVVNSVPERLELIQNYPNPFNPATYIEFTVPSTGRTTLKVVNIIGQDIITLYDGVAKAGEINRVIFNAVNYSAGIYFTRLQQGERMHTKKMMLVK
ncbi:MAG: T9SS type A sorting domain-containing protein [Bacteroidota bacterium]